MWELLSLLVCISCYVVVAQECNDPNAPELTPGEECYRKCGDEPRNCYWRFIIERYTVNGPACKNCTSGNMADCWGEQCVIADGFNKPIYTVNRKIPGPPIEVCEDDTIVVDIVNRLRDVAVSIHWHGIEMEGTPHMDGVAMITQCPIHPFTTFRYTFNVPYAGTYFWHSHIGTQKLDGINGPLIVRPIKSEDINGHLYDEDLSQHVVYIQDWIHQSSDYYEPGPHLPEARQDPEAVLINGLGQITLDGVNPNIPLANFTVTSGRRYRFRLIGGTCMTCAFIFRVQGHGLTLITGDGGNNYKPTLVDNVVLNSADRFDVILEANQPEGVYFVQVDSQDERCEGVRQVALLLYSSVVDNPPVRPIPPPSPRGVQLNPSASRCDGSNPNDICISMLHGEYNAPAAVGYNGPHYLITIAFGFYFFTVEELFRPGIFRRYEEPVYGRYIAAHVNNITFCFPSSPLLTQYYDDKKSQNDDCFPKDEEEKCTNIYEIELNAIVDVLIYDRADLNFTHPFHLHGYTFFVLTMGDLPEAEEEKQAALGEILTRAKEDNVKLEKRPMKDTISIPPRGYALIRFIADNPGYWLMHCHFLYHSENGMAAVFKVGKDQDMPPPPKGFPKCGNFYGY